MPRKPLSSYYHHAVILLWGIACLAFFQCMYRHHLFYQEQNQIFLLTHQYIASYMAKPAWLACLTGDFATQLYYYILAGPIIVTLTLLVMGDLARRALQMSGLGRHWAFGVAMVLITAEAFFCTNISYRLSSLIAICGGIAMFIAIRWPLRHRHGLFALATVIATPLAYWLFGMGLWFFFALSVASLVNDLREAPAGAHRWVMVFGLAPLAMIFVIMAAARQHYYLTPGKALTYPGMGKIVRPDFILERDLAVSDEYYFGNLDKVEEIVEKAGSRTDQMLFFYNLVKARKGELADNLLRYIPNQLGTFYVIGPETPKLTIINMNELYWVLGDMTLTERAAMMTNVFAPNNRNVRMIKRLAECNIVSGDTLAATKYLRLLQKTLAYKDWATRAMNGKGTGYLADKRPYINQADTIRLSDNLHMVMMELLDTNPGNTAALDYILCSTLLLKDITNFKRDYDRYCAGLGKPRNKKLYQQALMIYLAGTGASEEEWSRYIIDADELRRFREYSNNRGNPSFADTYWYYFDTAKAPSHEQ